MTKMRLTEPLQSADNAYKFHVINTAEAMMLMVLNGPMNVEATAAAALI